LIVIDRSNIAVGVNDEDFYRRKLLDDHSSSDAESDSAMIIPIDSTGTTLERSLLTPPEIRQSVDEDNPDEQARQDLLEHSSSSDNDPTGSCEPCTLTSDNDVNQFRPSIRLKRLTEIDTVDCFPLLDNVNERSSTDVRTESPQQHSSSLSSNEDEFRIRTRQKRTNEIRTRPLNIRRHRKSNHRRRDIIINYRASTTRSTSSVSSPIDIISHDHRQTAVNEQRSSIDAKKQSRTASTIVREQAKIDSDDTSSTDNSANVVHMNVDQ
jgi:hypothetical protein